MALIPWKPFDELGRFFEDDDWFLPVVPHHQAFGPAMDLYETDKDVVAEVNLPGIDPKNISISIDKQVLTVSGSAEEKKEEKKKGYWRKEIHKGSFSRSVQLPAAIDEDKIDASYEKGVLRIVMPKIKKAPEKKPIKIKIKK